MNYRNFGSLIKNYAVSKHISDLQLQSMVSDLILFQNYNISEDPLVESCIKQRCGRGYAELLDLLYNNRAFANSEFYLFKFVMYLIFLISIVNVV